MKKKTSTTEHSRYDSHTALEGALHCSPAAYKVKSDVVCHLSPFYLSPPSFQPAPPLSLYPCLGPDPWPLLGPLLAGSPLRAAGSLLPVSAPCPHAFQGLLDCRADFLAPLPLFAWLLCASSREWISIRIPIHTELRPPTHTLSPHSPSLTSAFST